MKFSLILLGAALYFVSSTEAAIKTGNPFSGVVWNGGDTEVVSWNDDGKAPTLEEIGLTTVELMAGGNVNQVPVATIGKLLASTGKASYKVPKDVGPPGDFYFIKFTAGDYTSFSGIFSIKNVDGKIAGFDPNNPNTKGPDVSVPKAIPSGPAPAYPSSPSPSTAPDAGKSNTAPKATDPKSNTSPAQSSPSAPTPISASDSTNLLPSFIGVVTTAVAFALTYLY